MIDVPVRNRATGRLLPMPTHTPKPGRPPGRKTAAAYLADSKAKLLQAGGRRLTVNLGPEATAALAEIRDLEQLGTDTAAIEDALTHRASQCRRRHAAIAPTILRQKAKR